jgi:threonine dehydrogenase-like Zn-dependent dehydrogenase
MGSSVLIFGAGPTGLVLAQMLRQNGGCNVVVAAPQGLKMNLAQQLGAGDKYIELSRQNPQAQFDALKAENPYGFDIVVEATGSQKILEDSINYVRRGGKLVVYGVYSSEVRVSWSPAKICEFFFSSFVLLVLCSLADPFQLVMRLLSLVVSLRHTSSLLLLITLTLERLGLMVLSTRCTRLSSGRSALRLCATSLLLRRPSPLTRFGTDVIGHFFLS